MKVDTQNKELKYWVGFTLIPGIGRVRLGQLESYFGSVESAWRASQGELRKSGLDPACVKSIQATRPEVDLDSEMEKMDKLGVVAFTFRDPGYPARLKETFDYPPVLYVRGSILPQDEWCIAVVGTRGATVYGKQVAGEISADIARSKITVVSGLARGIDTVAHRAALEVGGRTIAILASGLDTIYPAENASLARRIIENGAIVSEYPVGTRPRADNFPRRNRIMSGMSLGTLVVEAGETSGALITARMALEQNREVFAIPGSILSPVSRGTNRLIQEGAKLVVDYTDILEELNLMTVDRQMEMKELIPPTETEAVLLKQVGHEPTHIDEICRASGLPASTVSSTLAMMELKGMVKHLGAMNYSLARETRQGYKVEAD
jgi:DNA processing protein